MVWRTGAIKTNKRAKENERAWCSCRCFPRPSVFMLMIKLRQETDAEKATTRMAARCICALPFSLKNFHANSPCRSVVRSWHLYFICSIFASILKTENVAKAAAASSSSSWDFKNSATLSLSLSHSWSQCLAHSRRIQVLVLCLPVSLVYMYISYVCVFLWYIPVTFCALLFGTLTAKYLTRLLFAYLPCLSSAYLAIS